VQKPKFGLGRLSIQVSISHKHTHTRQDSSARVISPLQRPLPTKHTTSTRKNIHALSGIRTRVVTNQAAADLRLRPHGHRDRQQDVPEYNDNGRAPVAKRI